MLRFLIPRDLRVMIKKAFTMSQANSQLISDLQTAVAASNAKIDALAAQIASNPGTGTTDPEVAQDLADLQAATRQAVSDLNAKNDSQPAPALVEQPVS